jgi:hypothetical protein
MRALWLAVAVVLFPVQSGLAWGHQGHSILAEMAQRRLEPAALNRITVILKSELPGLPDPQISLASSWADDHPPAHAESAEDCFKPIAEVWRRGWRCRPIVPTDVRGLGNASHGRRK